MHLSIETPTPPSPPPRAKVGECGGFLWYLKVRFARGGGGFLRICFIVGIGLVPSFLTVISSHGHWCRSLDFNEPRFAVLFRHLVLKIFPFISSFRLILWDFDLSFHGSFAGKCYCFESKLLTQCRYTIFYL